MKIRSKEVQARVCLRVCLRVSHGVSPNKNFLCSCLNICLPFSSKHTRNMYSFTKIPSANFDFDWLQMLCKKKPFCF